MKANLSVKWHPRGTLNCCFKVSGISRKLNSGSREMHISPSSLCGEEVVGGGVEDAGLLSWDGAKLLFILNFEL